MDPQALTTGSGDVPVVAPPGTPAASEKRARRRGSRPISWTGQAIIIAVSLAYIVVEWRYNLRLMQIVIDPDLPRDSMDRFSTMGRIVGAFGLAWGLLRPFVSAFRGTLVQVGLFGGIWLCMFFGLTAAFKIVIDHVEPERKRAAMAIFQYRGELLRGTAEEPGIPLPHRDPLAGPVMMVDMAMLTYDREMVAAAADAMDRRAAGRANDLRQSADRQWTGYQRLHRAIDRMHRRHRDGSRAVAAARDPERAEREEREFRERMGGMDPQPDISRAEFVRSQLPRSSLRDARAIVRALDEVVMSAPVGETMRVRDVPHGMSRRTYDRWVEDRADELLFMLAPPAERINGHPHANAVVAAVYLPPIAMSLSLLAVVVNVAALLAQAMTSIVGLISVRWWKPFSLVVGMTLPACAVVAVGVMAGPGAYHAYPRADAARDRMVDQLGPIGRFWARASAAQVFVNGQSDRPQRLAADAVDRLERALLPESAETLRTADVPVHPDS